MSGRNERQKYFTDPQGKSGAHEDSIYPGSGAFCINSFALLQVAGDISDF